MRNKLGFSNIIPLVVAIAIGVVGLIGIGIPVYYQSIQAVNGTNNSAGSKNGAVDTNTAIVMGFTPVFIGLAVLSLIGGIIYIVSRGGE